MKKRLLPFALFWLTISSLTAQWEPKAFNTLPVGYYVSDISIVNESVVWAVAFDYAEINGPVSPTHLIKLLKSTNGGNDWEVKDIEAVMGRVSSAIHAFNETTAIITTNNGQSPAGIGLWRTTDGGDTWAELLSGNVGGGWLHFFDDQEGICININNMSRTADGGETWDTIPSANIPAFQSGESSVIHTRENSLPVIGNTLWFGTNKGRVFKSVDRGLTWEATPMGLGDNFIYSMAFVDEENGLALHATNYQLAKSSDGGATWTPVNNVGYDFTEVTAIPCFNVFVGVSWEDNITAISTDYGMTWELVDDQTSPWAPTFKSPNLGWMAEGAETGANAALYKWVGGILNTRTYVNHAASGANNGTSWADAYTDLQAALTAAEAGDEIWVAEGTYLPGGDPTSTFLIDKNLKLYGGFAGTECNLGERDVEQHLTILSGDVEGDDVPGDFFTSRTDNVESIMEITNNISNSTVINGFTFKGGHADGANAGSPEQYGGGIYSLGAPVVRHCIFEQNFAKYVGGAIYLFGNGAAGISIENCTFRENGQYHEDDPDLGSGGGLYAQQVAGGGVTLVDCDFTNNSSIRGLALDMLRCTFNIRGCLFADHENLSAERPTVQIMDPLGGTVQDCQISNNFVDVGAGMLIWRRSGNDPGDVKVDILNCTFSGNHSFQDANSAIGGGLMLVTGGTSTEFLVKGCLFENNQVLASGGGLGVQINLSATNAKVQIDSCQFVQNEAKYNGSGLYTAMFGQNTTLDITRCDFMENNTELFSAALDLWCSGGGSGTTLVDNCTFDGNLAGLNSGAVEIGNGHNGGGSMDFTVSNSTFSNNYAPERGGAISLWGNGNLQTDILIDKCVFDGNESSDFGGAIDIDPQIENFHVVISESEFYNNQSGRGAAVFSQSNLWDNGSVHFENCLLADNEASSAAVSINSKHQHTFLNCTIANNESNGIEIENEASLTLQNTILFNNGTTNFEALTNDVTVTSLGGNLISDGSLVDYALTYDQQSTDPLLDADYYPMTTPTSPAIDKGVDLGNLSEFDLDGNQRVNGCVDIGAYESDVIVSTECVTDAQEVMVGEVNLSPNPATDFIQLQLPETITQPTDISLFDAQGRLVEQRSFAPGQAVQVGHLPSGFYTVKLTDGDQSYVGRFVKQ